MCVLSIKVPIQKCLETYLMILILGVYLLLGVTHYIYLSLSLSLSLSLAMLAGVVEYTDCISTNGKDPLLSFQDMTQNNLMVRLQ